MIIKLILKLTFKIILLTVIANNFAFAQSETKKNFVFNHGFKDVWAAAQVILGNYPLETNDLNSGLMVTAKLGSNQFWQAPFEKPIDSGYSQVLSFQFFKPNNQTTQLQIIKKSFYQTDFLGSQKEVILPHWEELRLVYLIKREIEVKKILNRIK